MMSTVLSIAAGLAAGVRELTFAPPVAYVYRTLDYAWAPHATYLSRYAATPKRVLFLGMNPGPFGMAQTGIPFGEVVAVRDWMRITDGVGAPAETHEKRPVKGLACPKREVSGRRLWGLMADRFETAAAFFSDHIVMNYCPLLFLESGGRNLTPDKLPAAERSELFQTCDEALALFIYELRPEWIVGVGKFAADRAAHVCERIVGPASGQAPGVTRILHPSPANPKANRDWAGEATRQLVDSGVWS